MVTRTSSGTHLTERRKTTTMRQLQWYLEGMLRIHSINVLIIAAPFGKTQIATWLAAIAAHKNS